MRSAPAGPDRSGGSTSSIVGMSSSSSSSSSSSESSASLDSSPPRPAVTSSMRMPSLSSSLSTSVTRMPSLSSSASFDTSWMRMPESLSLSLAFVTFSTSARRGAGVRGGGRAARGGLAETGPGRGTHR